MCVVWFILGILGVWVYGSFAEYLLHRYVMHNKRISLSYNRHTRQHHVERRQDTFYEPDERYHLLKSSLIPLFWAVHIPLYALIGAMTTRCTGWGVAIGAAGYIGTYEILHFFIHAPRDFWFQRTRLFKWLCEYHRIHHLQFLWNYNVVLPLADLVFRTFSLRNLPPEPSAPEHARELIGPRSAFTR